MILLFYLITLIDSLAVTVKKYAPHALPYTDIAIVDPIPEDMPPGFLEKHETQIEDVGVPANACFFSLSNVNPQGW